MSSFWLLSGAVSQRNQKDLVSDHSIGHLFPVYFDDSESFTRPVGGNTGVKASSSDIQRSGPLIVVRFEKIVRIGLSQIRPVPRGNSSAKA